MKEEFDELLELEENTQDSKDIKRKMNIYLYKRIGIFFVIVSLILGCLYFITKQTKDAPLHYNPLEFKILDLDNQTSLQLLLSSYYRTQYSAIECYLFETNEIDKGHYELKVQEMKDTYYLHSGDPEEMTTIELNKNVITFNHIFTTWGYEYRTLSSDYKHPSYHTMYNLSKELEDLNKLPESSILEVSVSFKEEISASQLINLMKKYPDIKFRWAAVEVDNYQGAYGINLDNLLICDITESFDLKYPYLNSFDKYDEKQLEQHYLSTLQLLMDYPELSDKLFDKDPHPTLEEQYNKAKEEISFIGVKCYIKKDELIQGIKNKDFEYGFIVDIRYSKYER